MWWNWIRILVSGKFLLVEKNQVGKFNVRFIHKNNGTVFVCWRIINLNIAPANTVVSPRTSQLRPLTDLLSLYVLVFQSSSQVNLTFCFACVANVSVRYSEQRTRNESQRQREKWPLVSFLSRPKPKIPFLSRSLLWNQTEMFATQATLCLIRAFS